MSAGFRITPALWDKIHHFASFPQTGVSLQQMVLFGQNPSQGTLFKASQFLLEELPVRLAHRMKELDELPQDLNKMPSINKVKNWYAESFQELISVSPIVIAPEVRKALLPQPQSMHLPGATPNPSVKDYPTATGHTITSSANGNGNGNGTHGGLKLRVPIERRYSSPYYAKTGTMEWPPEIHDFNGRFTKLLEKIKRRHDPTVTTVCQGVLERKRSRDARDISLDMQKTGL